MASAVVLLFAIITGAALAEPLFVLPKYRIEANELGVIVNRDDPLSVQIADHYRAARNIPPENMIEVAFDGNRTDLSPKAFIQIYEEIQSRTPKRVQAYALTWAQPYRVGCMSITSAIAMGFDESLCAKPSCRSIDKVQPYLDSHSARPFADFGIRPTMAIAALSFAEAKKLIDRGVASDGSAPAGTGYLVSTSDKERNVRSTQYEQTKQMHGNSFKIEMLRTDMLLDKQDVMFYFTGMKAVSGLDTLGFLPGAIADHLTSSGGQLTDSRQMSALRWLEAGATGSYGAVVEPCNYPTKFPAPGAVMAHYLHGATLIEAYWKSVAWPQESLFIGEPLAAPFAGHRVERKNNRILLHTRALKPGRYGLLSSASILGPFRSEPFVLKIGASDSVHELPDFGERVYALRPLGAR